VKLLCGALRLSSSVISRHADMLGAQLVGRLLPYYTTQPKIRDLIRQCDQTGASRNALVPGHHCLQTPGGPLQYSLEGHPFAPFGIDVTTDSRYLVSASTVFIIWDLATGDVFRQISPGIRGIMRHLAISGDDRRAMTYTSSNQVRLTVSIIYWIML